MPKRAQPGWRLGARELVGYLEAVYQLEADEPTWLAEVMAASRRVWARDGWVHGAVYDASDVARFRTTTQHVIDAPDTALGLLAQGLELFTPGLVVRSFRIAVASLARELTQPELAPVYAGMAALGYPQTLGLNGVDPSGFGVFIGLWGAEMAAPAGAELAVYRQMAHHLAAAHRYRRRIHSGEADCVAFDPTIGAEAILDAHGRVLHATGPAQDKRSQAALIETSHARDLARTSRAGDRDALGRWPALTSARWTLVDSYERSGQRYVVARENQACRAGLDVLSDRERQVVAYLAIGQSTKETAYALGISDATVRVLLARAAGKLGVKSRRGVLAHPEVQPLIPH
jgi:DNA-binding CsgD family transcriptional regulator